MSKKTIVVLVILVLAAAYLAYRSSNKVSVSGGATVSTISITSDTSSAAAVLAGAKSVNWETSNYPSGAGVNLNLLRKVSDSPKEYTLVRVLATNTENDGSESWTPMDGEDTGDLYIEVTCASAYQFDKGCSLKGEPVKAN